MYVCTCDHTPTSHMHTHVHQFPIRDSVFSLLVFKINHMYNEALTFIYSMLAQRVSC